LIHISITLSTCSALLFYPFFFLFHHPAPTQIYTLSLHDALPIYSISACPCLAFVSCKQKISGWWSAINSCRAFLRIVALMPFTLDRKSTRLNSSHLVISYAVFCLKKKKI